MKNQRRVAGPARASWRNTQWSRDRSRLSLALALSVCFHAFLLSLQFGAAGLGLPGLALPWAERRVQASNLTARLVNLPRPQAPAPVPPSVLPRVPPATAKSERPKPVKPALADKSIEVRPPTAAHVAPPEAPLSSPRREISEPAPAAEARDREREIPARPQPEILAQTDPQQETFNVPPPAEEAEARRKAEGERRKEEEARKEETARREAEERARERVLALQKELEAKTQEETEARRKAEGERRKEEEATRLEEASRIALARKQEEAEARRWAEVEKRKEEDARRIALEAEAARQQAAVRQKELEAQRQAEEETRRKAEEAEARRKAEVERRKEQEAKRLEELAAAQRERERLAAEQPPSRAAPGAIDGARPAGAAPAPGPLSGRDLAAKALEQLRAPGAVPADPPRPPSQPGSAEPSRRRSIFGAERDVILRMYVDNWRWKIERYGTLNYRSSASARARDNPVVTVAIRSDGSLEDVLIHRSSGLRELDEAVRRIAKLHAPYSAFPPALARQYDVIEIRRVWFFDDTLRILEEM